jgi:hypothetical protein
MLAVSMVFRPVLIPLAAAAVLVQKDLMEYQTTFLGTAAQVLQVLFLAQLLFMQVVAVLVLRAQEQLAELVGSVAVEMVPLRVLEEQEQ